MTVADRGRTITAVLLAVLVHVVAAVAITVFGGSFEPYPESTPVIVTLPQYDDSPTEPAPSEPEPRSEPQPVAAEPEPVTPAPRDSAPPPASQTEQPPAAPREPPQPLPWEEQGSSAEREAARVDDQDLFPSDEPDAATADLPSWVVAGEVSRRPEESLAPQEQAVLDRKRETLEGFDARLNALGEALDNPRGPSSAPSPQETGTATATRSDLPGDGIIEWIGSGGRQAVSTDLPPLTGEDFGGQVPARVNYIIVFEVDSAGAVVPGSLILRQSSGYTLADQKIRSAVLRWRFEPAGNAPTVTAIASLQITRDEIR